MAQGAINPVQRSLLRASGLALLTVFLIKTINSLGALQLPLQPTAVLRLTHELMDHSVLLAISLLLLLLSLSDQFVVLGEPQEPRQLGLRDGLLLRARTLVGLLAVLYVLLIPITLIQAQTLQTVSDRVVEQKLSALRQQLQEASRHVSQPEDKSLTVASLKQRYPWLNKANVHSLGETRSLLQETLRNAGPYYKGVKLAGRRDLHLQSLRLCLIIAIYGGLIGYLWYRWPRMIRPVGLAHDLQSQDLGVTLHDLPDVADTRGVDQSADA